MPLNALPVCFLLIFLLASFRSAALPADSLTAALRALAEGPSPLPGFAVAIVDSGGVRYEAGFGLADQLNRTAFTPATVQAVGSVSKTLIGVALLKAQELGLLHLDDDINSLLSYRIINPHGTYRPIRVIDLATHTSSILDREKPYRATYRWAAEAMRYTVQPTGSAPTEDPYYAPTAMAAWLRAYLLPGGRQYRKSNFAAAAPGATYHYSNVGATLAAHLIEVKSGLSYADFTRRYILKPMQMSSAGWTRHDSAVAGAPQAVGYSRTGKRYPLYFGLTYPDGGLRASTHDLAAYLRCIIRGAQGGADSLLATASFHDLLRPRFGAVGQPVGLNPREPDSGVFWAIRADGEVGHVGSDPGIFTVCFFDPRTGVGRVFMTNVDFDDNPAAAQRFAAIWRTLGRFSGRLAPEK